MMMMIKERNDTRTKRLKTEWNSKKKLIVFCDVIFCNFLTVDFVYRILRFY